MFHVKRSERWNSRAAGSAPKPGREMSGVLSGYGGGMTRLLITGVSGVGKSTLLAALSDRGHVTVDTD